MRAFLNDKEAAVDRFAYLGQRGSHVYVKGERDTLGFRETALRATVRHGQDAKKAKHAR